MADDIKEQRRKEAEALANNPEGISEMIACMEGPSRRERQHAASVFALVATSHPEILVPHISAFIDALNRPESQTRWECLDVLTALVPLDSRGCEKAIPEAEGALFDEGTGPLHLSALRFLCHIGSTTAARSLKVWPSIDEAMQCYHGDFEYQEMLSAVASFAEGSIDKSVKEELKARVSFDAQNSKGSLKKSSQHILDILS